MKISEWLKQSFKDEQLTDFEILELENRLVRLFVKMVKAVENQEKYQYVGVQFNRSDI